MHSSRTLLRGGNPNPVVFKKSVAAKQNPLPPAKLLYFALSALGVAFLALLLCTSTTSHVVARSARRSVNPSAIFAKKGSSVVV